MQWKYAFMVFAGAVSYGVLSTFVKLAYGAGYTVGTVTGSQMIIAVLLIWAFYFVQQTKTETPHSNKGWGWLMLTGTTIGLTGLLYYSSLLYIPASLAILLLFQFTWMGVLYEICIQRKRPSKEKWIALLFLFVGTLLASGLLIGSRSEWHWLGILFGLLAAVSYTVLLIASGRVATDQPPLKRSAWMTTGGMLLVFCLAPSGELLQPMVWSGIWPYALPLGFFVFLSTLLINKGAPAISPGLTSILGAAELPTAVISSHLILQEHVTASQWLGVFFILMGVAYPEWVRYRLSQRQHRSQSNPQ